MNGFASIRFDRALDETDRSLLTHVLASRDARPTSWATAGTRTYAIVRDGAACDDALAREIDARIDVPALVVLRVRPVVKSRLGALGRALLGPGRPQTVIGGAVFADDIVVEMQPTGPALRLLLALIDETLIATPGRTIVPVLPFNDEMLAAYASLRLRESHLNVSRVLDPYVEHFAHASGNDA